MRVNGLFGHVRRNDAASLALFVGFLFAFQLIAAVALFLPLAVFDEAHAPIYDWGGYAIRYMPIVGVAGTILFAVNLWWHVQTVARTLDLRYVDNTDEPRLCRIVEPIAIAAGIATPYVAVIETPALNAFACGIRAGDMVVVVTRGLIDGLDDDELGAVVAHEIVHIARGDTRLMAAVNVLGRNLQLLQSQNMLRVKDWRQVALMIVLPAFFPLILISGLCTQLAFRAGHLSRLLISSAREYIADAEAVRLTHNPAALVRALQKIEGRSAVAGIASELDAMMIDGATTGALATHPTVAERVATLVGLTGSMAIVAPAGRDTRPNAGFGRRREAGIAVVPPMSKRPTWSALLRVNEGSDRNIFGLNRQTTPLVIGAAAILCVVHWNDLNDPAAMVENFDIGPAKALIGGAAYIARCNAGQITGNPGWCEGPAVDVGAILGGTNEGFAKINNAMDDGGRFMTASGFVPAAKPDPFAEMLMANRCYRADFYDDDARIGRYRLDQEMPSGHTMPRILGWADTALGKVAAAPVADRDAGLRNYVDMRKRAGEFAHHYYGKPGLDLIRARYADAAHAAVVAEIGARIVDPAFTGALEPYDRIEYASLATDPSAFIPCVARRKGH